MLCLKEQSRFVLSVKLLFDVSDIFYLYLSKKSHWYRNALLGEEWPKEVNKNTEKNNALGFSRFTNDELLQ